jgi:hypothetical protein
MAFHGFFLKKEAAGIEAVKLVLKEFTNDSHFMWLEEIVEKRDEIKDFLARRNFLKEGFGLKGDQTKLAKALKRVLLYSLTNTNFFGYSDTINIMNRLSENCTDYNTFRTESGSFSMSSPNVIAMAYSRFIQSDLGRERRNEVLNEFAEEVMSIQVDSITRQQNLEESLNNFLDYINSHEDLSAVYGEYLPSL